MTLNPSDYRRLVLRLVDIQHRQTAADAATADSFARLRATALLEAIAADRAAEGVRTRADRAAARVERVRRLAANCWRGLSHSLDGNMVRLSGTGRVPTGPDRQPRGLMGPPTHHSASLGPPPIEPTARADVLPESTDPEGVQAAALSHANRMVVAAIGLGIGRRLPLYAYAVLPAVGAIVAIVVATYCHRLPYAHDSAGAIVLAVVGTFLAPFATIPVARYLADLLYAARLDTTAMALCGLCGLVATAIALVFS